VQAENCEGNRLSVVVSSKLITWAQVVSRRPLTTEARVRARVNLCGICGGQSGTGTGFCPSSSVFPCQYHSTVALQTHIIWGMRNMLTLVSIHAWVLDPPHLQDKKVNNRVAEWAGCLSASVSARFVFRNVDPISTKFGT
jgi:hypothetical protein